MATMSWKKQAIAAFLLDDPALDVDPLRASKRARDAVKRVFLVAKEGRAPSRFGAAKREEQFDAGRLSGA